MSRYLYHPRRTVNLKETKCRCFFSGTYRLWKVQRWSWSLLVLWHARWQPRQSAQIKSCVLQRQVLLLSWLYLSDNKGVCQLFLHIEYWARVSKLSVWPTGSFVECAQSRGLSPIRIMEEIEVNVRTWIKYVSSLVTSLCLPSAVIKWSAKSGFIELAQWMAMFTRKHLVDSAHVGSVCGNFRTVLAWQAFDYGFFVGQV